MIVVPDRTRSLLFARALTLALALIATIGVLSRAHAADADGDG